MSVVGIVGTVTAFELGSSLVEPEPEPVEPEPVESGLESVSESEPVESGLVGALGGDDSWEDEPVEGTSAVAC